MALAWLSVRVLSSFSPPSSGKQELLLNSFSIELTVQCDGCLIWGLGWRAGLMAGFRVGQAYGVFHRPGFGLLVSVSRSLRTQTPFATRLLIGPQWSPHFKKCLWMEGKRHICHSVLLSWWCEKLLIIIQKISIIIIIIMIIIIIFGSTTID